MKIAFDVDVLSKQMSINDLVHQVADWGYKYIEQSPHPRINPFYKHPLFSKECEEEYRKALKETGVEISSFICVYRWSGPTEEQRKMAVANWKKMIEIAVNMGVPVINTELSGDPNQQEICNGMWFRSMEELLPIIEREGLRVEIQSHPYDFCELNDEACDMVKSFRSKNLGYVYSSPHGFFYDQGKGDVRHMLKYAGDELTHGDLFVQGAPGWPRAVVSPQNVARFARGRCVRSGDPVCQVLSAEVGHRNHVS